MPGYKENRGGEINGGKGVIKEKLWKRLREETEEEMEETAEKNLKPVTNLPRLDQL